MWYFTIVWTHVLIQQNTIKYLSYGTGGVHDNQQEQIKNTSRCDPGQYGHNMHHSSASTGSRLHEVFLIQHIF